jgi:hypothetical protein
MKKKPMTVVEMGRLGGLARAHKLTAKELSEQGRHAVLVRWRKRRPKKS